MKNFARIVDDVAVDVSADPTAHFHPDIAAAFSQVPAEVRSQWRRIDGLWTPPPPPPEPAPVTWENANPQYWWIDVGPFLDRFGAKALAITSSADPEVRGLLNLITPRKYIDLKRADLPSLLGILIAKQYLTVEDVNAILTKRTTDYERHIKGLPQPQDGVA